MILAFALAISSQALFGAHHPDGINLAKLPKVTYLKIAISCTYAGLCGGSSA